MSFATKGKCNKAVLNCEWRKQKCTAVSDNQTPAPPPPAPPPPPTCDEGDPSCNKKLIGYYTNWAQYRAEPAKFFPEDMDGTLFTHVCYAFAMIHDAPSFGVYNYEWNDVPEGGDSQGGMYDRFHAHLRKQNPSIKTLISLGGWGFNLKAATKHIFTTMASTSEGRAAFIASCIAFARKHTFDGVDIDWEYPGFAAQGGRPQDKENFTLLLQEFRAAITVEALSTGKDPLLLTIAVSASSGMIDNGYEVAKIHQHLDWIGVMSYDLHGSWDANTGMHSGLYAADAGDDKSVSGAMDIWRARGAPVNKLVLGVGSYGRGWTLASTSNTAVGAPADPLSPASRGRSTRKSLGTSATLRSRTCWRRAGLLRSIRRRMQCTR